MENKEAELVEIGRKCRNAALSLATTTVEQRNAALEAVAAALEANADEIASANQLDLDLAKGKIRDALYARLKLDAVKLEGAILGVRNVGNLVDPIGQVQLKTELDQGLVLTRIACPLGVLGIIFEARPEALIQITSLAIKSGNGVILKGGSESVNSCITLARVIKEALAQVEADTGISPDTVQLLTTRDETRKLLALDKYVNLIIPRGSNSFVKFVKDNTQIPVLGHADGICHMYFDENADLAKAIRLLLDGKGQYCAACNAIETLLLHQSLLSSVPQIVQALQENNIEVVADSQIKSAACAGGIDIELAADEDWSTEYSALKVSAKCVDSMSDAIDHINSYGSKHTDVIITEDEKAAETFLRRVDAAGVYHNCSSRFADGFRYGFGAEVGISTQTLPPRGPVGLEGLVTYKYLLRGNGHIVADYTGENAKPFSHKTLDI